MSADKPIQGLPSCLALVFPSICLDFLLFECPSRTHFQKLHHVNVNYFRGRFLQISSAPPPPYHPHTRFQSHNLESVERVHEAAKTSATQNRFLAMISDLNRTKHAIAV